MLRALCPPILVLLFRKLRYGKTFFGVYKKFEEVCDENPWGDKSWLGLSRKKLSDLESNELFPKPLLDLSVALPCLMVNVLSWQGKCRVLDFAGGTGLIFYSIRAYLANPANVFWDVVDEGELGEIGKNSELSDDSIKFFDQLPSSYENHYDIVYINTSLQYIADYKGLLDSLISYNPSCLILTRLLSGDIETFVTSQKILGKRSPCQIINYDDLICAVSAHGYDLIFRSPEVQENLEGRYDKSVPKSLQIPYPLNLIFMKRLLPEGS